MKYQNGIHKVPRISGMFYDAHGGTDANAA
jgi:hypothetical protein